MLLNQARKRDVKQFQSRAKYFRSYNQQPHRKEYLREYSKVRRLVAKYNPTYQDKKKGDRHKLSRKNRYQLKALTQELVQRGWKLTNQTRNQISSSPSPFIFFTVALVDKKSPQTYFNYKSLVFLHGRERPSEEQKQEAYLFSYLVQKEGQQLRELLGKKPQLFRKRLKAIEQTIQVVSQHWKKPDLIQTINQIPQVRGWQLSNYWEKGDLNALLLRNGEAGGKNKLVLDFDHYKRGGDGEYLMSGERRKEIDLVIDYLINYWKLPWYEISKSGARKLHLNVDELPLKSKLWWKGLVIGDILGKGSQTTLPLSKGRRVEFSKWSWVGMKLPEIRLEDWEKDLGKFSLSGEGKKLVIARDFTEVKIFLSTNTTSQKGLSYYGTKIVKPLQIFPPRLVEKLSSVGGSRDSFYYQVPYLDSSGQVESFLVDRGWREREFGRVVGGNFLPSELLVRVGERCDFLVRVG